MDNYVWSPFIGREEEGWTELKTTDYRIIEMSLPPFMTMFHILSLFHILKKLCRISWRR